MPGFVKRVAVLAAVSALAAGCTDSYPVPLPPTTSFYLPSGIGVHPLNAAGTTSALVVVSTNFDLRYAPVSGGTVLSVDPDASNDTTGPVNPGQLEVLSALNIGSFGGEVAVVEPACTTSWPSCRGKCAPLAGELTGNGALVVTTSRYNQAIYSFLMDGSGSLSCGPGCVTQLPAQYLDPYGVGVVCTAQVKPPLATAYVTQLRAANNQGILSRLDLGSVLAATPEAPPVFDTLLLAAPNTYTSVFGGDDVSRPSNGLLFLSTQLGLTQPLRWIAPLGLPAVTPNAVTAPDVHQVDLASYLVGTLTLDMAVSNDGTRLYVALQQIDTTALAQSGTLIPLGGLLGVFSLALDAYNQPSMDLFRAVDTCLGGGQVRVLPPRPGMRDLVAVTCDTQSSLVLYDDQSGQVIYSTGVQPATGQPLLGRGAFGLAVELVDPSRAIVQDFPATGTTPLCPNYTPVPPTPPSPCYNPSPCVGASQCVRLYVASFEQSFVSILELDPRNPAGIQLVKRVGAEGYQ